MYSLNQVRKPEATALALFTAHNGNYGKVKYSNKRYTGKLKVSMLRIFKGFRTHGQFAYSLFSRGQ